MSALYLALGGTVPSSAAFLKSPTTLLWLQPVVAADGSDPREVKQWHRQQKAESELAAAEEAVRGGHKVCLSKLLLLIFAADL